MGFPAETTSFVGRRQELTDAKRLLSTARLLTLTGPGGVGKTRLAARLTEQVARSFPDGVFVVPLAALRDGTLVPHAVMDELGIRDEAGGRPADILTGHLLRRRTLLVLDNCEHMLDICASLIDSVLAAAPDVRVLVTSRQRLGLPGEHLLTVPPLPAPASGSYADADLFPAVRLFADRAAAVLPGFEVTASNQAAVGRLCRRLDGLPLAIELAAVRMRALGVDQLAERVEDRYRLLTSGSPVTSPRHQTLRSAVDWSYDLCTEPERAAWSRLSVIAGSFDLDAAEAVCGQDVLDTVTGLVEKSILLREDTGGTARYRMLETLRQYGLEKLDAVDDTRRRHRDHLVRLTSGCGREWFGPDQLTIMERLRVEQDNLRAALDFCVAAPGEEQQGLRLVENLWFYWAARGGWVEVRHWWRRLMRGGEGAPAVRPAQAVWLTALMPAINSRTASVLLGNGAAEPALASRDVPVVKPLTFHGRPERALPICTDALAVCAAYGEQWIRSYILRALAMAQWALGAHADAVESARRCLRLDYVSREPHATAWTLEVLALATVAAGNAEHGAALLGAARRVWYDIGFDPLSRGLRISERQAREALGDVDYDRAFQRGRSGAESPAAPVEPAADSVLTKRERQVAELIAEGLTNRQIAEKLVISQRTAEGHVERILAKLSFATRTQVAAWISAR